MTRKGFDAAVVGGGLVGMALAYGLVRLGRSVVVLDEGDLAWRASRGNFGLVWVQGKGLGLSAYSNWTQRSARLWPELAGLLAADAGIGVSLEQPGGFQVCLSEAEMQTKLDSMEQLMAQPGLERYDYQVYDNAALRKVYPGIGPEVVGGTYSRLDGHVNALRLFRALHTAAQRSGVQYRPMARVEAIAGEGGAFVLRTGQGEVSAGQVLLAAGLDNARLAPQLGLSVPVRPQRGQILVLERLPRFMDYPIVTLRQTDEGSVLVGDSLEEVGLDDAVGTAVLATLADRAARIFPALAQARVVRMWGALRVMSPDGFPIYAQSAEMPGAYAATCHSGVTLAAAHALALAPQIAEGRLDPGLAPFSTERFHVQENR